MTPHERLIEQTVKEGITLWCICDEEMCWCAADVNVRDPDLVRKVLNGQDYTAPCPDCAAGKHRMEGPSD